MTLETDRRSAGNTARGSEPSVIAFSSRNAYSDLPERFYARLPPTPVRSPRLIHLNVDLALSLGLNPDRLASKEGVEILAGNRIATGSTPLAMAYAGHQFGHFVPQLGDGRANLLGELTSQDGIAYDVQLKGSGRTPFSRGGDGRAAMGPVLREYLLSEAMAALGTPTTRALAAVSTGEQVVRERLLPGAVLTRVAASHLHVGTFEYFSVRQDTDAIRRLADYAIARHYPHCITHDRPYRALLDSVITRQAHLIAQWMLLGFIHGVMNTDNTSIAGETIDYGPCAFLEAYDPDKVFSSIDHRGRYAYSNQPHAARWNLARFAEALLPLLIQEEGTEEAAIAAAHSSLSAFDTQFEAARLAGWRRKTGLLDARVEDSRLIEHLLELMHTQRADFTLTFRRLCAAALGQAGDAGVRSLFANPGAYDAWAFEWRRRLSAEEGSAEERRAAMLGANPAFIARNHLVQSVIDAAVDGDDFKPFSNLLEVVTHPYDDRPGLERFSAPAQPGQCVTQTFCGT